MAANALFLGWNRPVPGREGKTLALFEKTVGYLSAQQAEGRIESFEPVFMSAHGGDINGFILIRGDAAKLAELQQDSNFLDIVFRADHGLQGFGLLPAFIGEGLTENMQRWAEIIAED